MKVNVENFKSIIKKATLNNSIDTVQLLIDPQSVKSRMISSDNTGIAILDMNNDIINVKEELEFNFSEPAQQLLPYLNLIDEEEAEIIVKNEKIILKSEGQKANLNFCSPTVVNVFQSEARETDYFLTLELDEDFINAFSKIKKISSRFGRIYFNVEDGIFSIETTDKSNKFSNGLKFDLEKIDGVDDLVLSFTAKNITDLMAVINSDFENFKLNFTYVPDAGVGLVFAESNDSSEKYYIMSNDETQSIE